MSAFLTLTRREIAERSPLLWGTLAAALIPILARLQPWLRPELRRDFHEGLAGIFGITFPLALALGLGASVVGEDLAHRRLGFYFSRPVNAWTVWASKTLAAAFVTLLAWVSFVLPVFLASGNRITIALADADWFFPWTGGLLCLMFLAQAVAGAYRARDGLFALDIVAFATLVSLGAGIGWRLHAAGAETLVLMVWPAIVVAALAAAVAGALQVVVGRTDARRGHLALSACLWGTLTTGLLVAAGFSAWVLSVAPRDVGALSWSVRATASGSHLVFLAARPRVGYQPTFLLDTGTGGFDRLPQWMRGFAFSKDGRRAVWIESDDSPEIVLRRLDAPGSSVVRSPLRGYAGLDPLLAGLSDDGRRAVVATRTRIALVDTDSGREAASAGLEQFGVAEARGHVLHSRWAFDGDGVVGFFFFTPPPSAARSIVVSTFDTRTGRVGAGPRVDGFDQVREVRDGRALVSGKSGALAVVDRSELRPLLQAQGGVAVGSAALLDGGRAAALVDRGGDRRLVVWDRRGQPALDVPFPPGVSLVSREPRWGWLALGSDFYQDPRTVLVDLATGGVVREHAGFLPTVTGGWLEHHALPAGSPGARIFVGKDGAVVRLDPETGRVDAILVPPVPEG